MEIAEIEVIRPNQYGLEVDQRFKVVNGRCKAGSFNFSLRKVRQLIEQGFFKVSRVRVHGKTENRERENGKPALRLLRKVS